MQKILYFLSISFALLYAQDRTKIVPITPGITKGAIQNNNVDPTNLAPVLYSLYIPQNTTSIEFTLWNTDQDNCEFLELTIATQIPPCQKGTFGINDSNTFCLFGTGVISEELSRIDIEPGYRQGWAVYETDTTIFLGVSTENNYIGEACTYQLDVAFNTSCKSGEVAIQNGDSIECVQYKAAEIDLKSTKNYKYNGTVMFPHYNGQWQFPIPVGTGNIHFQVISEGDLAAFGKQNAGASSYFYDCAQFSAEHYLRDGKDEYLLDFYCYSPESGYVYLNLVPIQFKGPFSFYLTSDTLVCQIGAYAGHNCSYPTFEILDFTIEFIVEFSAETQSFRYFYYTLPEYLDQQNLLLYVMMKNVTGEDLGVVTIAKDSFPEVNMLPRKNIQETTCGDGETVNWLYTFYDGHSPLSLNWIGLFCSKGTCNFSVFFETLSYTPEVTTEKYLNIEINN